MSGVFFFQPLLTNNQDRTKVGDLTFFGPMLLMKAPMCATTGLPLKSNWEESRSHTVECDYYITER